MEEGNGSRKMDSGPEPQSRTTEKDAQVVGPGGSSGEPTTSTEPPSGADGRDFLLPYFPEDQEGTYEPFDDDITDLDLGRLNISGGSTTREDPAAPEQHGEYNYHAGHYQRSTLPRFVNHFGRRPRATHDEYLIDEISGETPNEPRQQQRQVTPLETTIQQQRLDLNYRRAEYSSRFLHLQPLVESQLGPSVCPTNTRPPESTAQRRSAQFCPIAPPVYPRPTEPLPQRSPGPPIPFYTRPRNPMPAPSAQPGFYGLHPQPPFNRKPTHHERFAVNSTFAESGTTTWRTPKCQIISAFSSLDSTWGSNTLLVDSFTQDQSISTSRFSILPDTSTSAPSPYNLMKATIRATIAVSPLEMGE